MIKTNMKIILFLQVTTSQKPAPEAAGTKYLFTSKFKFALT